MISTPILDFVRDYAAKHPVRLHMPGHKGVGPLGFEARDITEIDSAGELYATEGRLMHDYAAGVPEAKEKLLRTVADNAYFEDKYFYRG